MRPAYSNGWWAVVALATLSAAATGTDALRLLTVPLAALALWRLAETAGPVLAQRLPALARAALAPLAIVIAAVALYFPLLRGDLPLNHDHPVMLLRAWTAWQHLSVFGVTGFETGQMAGMPADGYYPVGVDLLVIGLRGLSAGLLSWEAAYCLGLFLGVLAYPLALFALGKRISGTVAGLAAGLLGLVDRGAWFQSGWDFTVNWGAWAMGTSFALSLWTIWSLDRLLRRANVFAITLTGLAAGLAVLFHPMAVAILGVSVPLLLLLAVLEDGPGAFWERLPALTCAGALALALPAFWLFPFVAHRDWYGSEGYVWRSFEEVVRGLLSGVLLKAFSPLLLFSGLAGLALAAQLGTRLARFFLLGAALLLFVSTDSFLILFGLLDRFPVIGQLMYERFAYFIRTALVLGAGLLVGLLAARARSLIVAEARPAWRTQALRLLLLVAATPFALYGLRAKTDAYFVPAVRLGYASQSSVHGDLRASAAFLRSLPAADVGRVALSAPTHEHVLLLLRAYTGLPVFKLGFTSDNLFNGKFESQDRVVWRALGVRHVLALGPLAQVDLEEVRRFGSLFLYRVVGPPPSAFTLRGPGQAVLVRESENEMAFSLSDTTSETRLVVHRAAHALWHAQQGGRELGITRTSIGDAPPVFMEIAAGDGPLTLTYRLGVAERLGALLSWLGWLTIGILLVVSASDRLRARLVPGLGRWPHRLAVAVRFGAVGLMAALALLLAWRGLAGPAAPYPGRVVVANLSQRLPNARADVQRGPKRSACRPYDGQRLRCPGADWHYVGEVVQRSAGLLRQCIWLRPARNGRLSVHFDDVPLGDRLQGHFAFEDSVAQIPGLGPVTFIAQLDGQELARFTRPAERGWNAWDIPTPGRSGTRGRVTFSSEAATPGHHNFCFTAASTVDRR